MSVCVDLFAGAGGLSEGLRQAGWVVSRAYEYVPTYAATHHANHPTTTMVLGDVRAADYHELRGQIDLVAGGPPCQPFSVAGKQQGANDARDMLSEFVRAVEEIQPTLVLMENVAGLATPRQREHLDRVVLGLGASGYAVVWGVLDAADYGVPQHRKRLIVLGSRRGRPCLPARTHGTADSPWVTAHDALIDVPASAPNRSKVYYAKNPHLHKTDHNSLVVNGRGRAFPLDRPALTVTGTISNGGHIFDPAGVLARYCAELRAGALPRTGEVVGVRRFTVRESARLQGFADSYQFLGSVSAQFAQIGNAVPPPLARALGAALISQLG